MGLLDGTDPTPVNTLEVEDLEKKKKKKVKIHNPAYEVWIARDQQLASYLVKGISPDLIGDILGLKHAAEI